MRQLRSISLVLLTVAVAIATVCGCSKKSSSHSPTPPGSLATQLKIQDPQFSIGLENSPYTVTILTLDTDGKPAAYSGTAEIFTATPGFVTPTVVALSGTATSLTLNYRLGADNHLLLRAAGLNSAYDTVYVQGERPAVVDGPLAEGAVLVGSGVAVTWDSAGVYSPAVLAGVTMRMFYAGFRTGQPSSIGLATSVDGLNWTRSGAAPVVGPGAMASNCHTNGADRPQVMAKVGGGGFLMYYRGTNGTNVHACLAESTDGNTWTPFLGSAQDHSVLAPEAVGFDSKSIDGMAAFPYESGYGALYSFHGSFPFAGMSSASGFAFATSPDGQVWTRQNAATFSSAQEISWADQPPVNSWDGNILGPVTVFPDQSAYRIWAQGFSIEDTIGYYTTSQFHFMGGHCDNFTEDDHEMIEPVAATFDSFATREPGITVGPDGKRWMYFTGIDLNGRSSIGVARFSQ